MDWEKARALMIKQQIQTWHVLDATLLDRLSVIKREDFVPISKQKLAFADLELPLGIANATMLTPKVEARIVQAVAPKPTDKGLIIGVGSGYLAALVGSFANTIYAIDIEPDVVTFAKSNLQRAAIKNVSIEVGDGNVGLNAHAPYDIIIITCATPRLPQALKPQLRKGGRIFAVLGEAPNMQATLITYCAAGSWHEKVLFETTLPLLAHAPRPPRFVF